MRFNNIAAALLLAPVLAFAQSTTDRQACQTTYKNKITECAKGLSFLDKQIRAGAQKACTKSAQLTRDVCLGGTGNAVCLESCQSAYNTTVLQCEASFNPVDCGGSVVCEQIIGQQRSECISDAVDVLNACSTQCTVQ